MTTRRTKRPSNLAEKTLSKLQTRAKSTPRPKQKQKPEPEPKPVQIELPEPNFEACSPEPETSLLYPPEPPVLYYTPDVHEQIQTLIKLCQQEVSWMGLVSDDAGIYKVHKLYIPKQVVTGATVDVKPEAMSELFMQIVADGHDPSDLYYHGHSHVDMQVSPSGTDEKWLAYFLKSCPRFFRGIYNKHGERKVDFFDVNANLFHQCIDDETFFNTQFDKKAFAKLIQDNVKETKLPNFQQQSQINLPDYLRPYPQDDFSDEVLADPFFYTKRER